MNFQQKPLNGRDTERHFMRQRQALIRGEVAWTGVYPKDTPADDTPADDTPADDTPADNDEEVENDSSDQ